MEDKARVTTDPGELAVRTLELLAPSGYVELGNPRDPCDATEARRFFRESVSTGPSIQYRARSAWHAAQHRRPLRASLVAATEFAYARAIDASAGDSSKLAAWRAEEERSPALAEQAQRLAPVARDVAAIAGDFWGLLPRVAELEAHLTQAAAATQVAADQAELRRALSVWRAVREACVSAEHLAAQVLLEGSGLPAERRQLRPAPLWPENGQQHHKQRAAIVYADFCRLDDAGISAEDLTLIAYGKHTKELEKRIRIQIQRTRTAKTSTNPGPEM